MSSKRSYEAHNVHFELFGVMSVFCCGITFKLKILTWNLVQSLLIIYLTQKFGTQQNLRHEPQNPHFAPTSIQKSGISLEKFCGRVGLWMSWPGTNHEGAAKLTIPQPPSHPPIPLPKSPSAQDNLTIKMGATINEAWDIPYRPFHPDGKEGFLVNSYTNQLEQSQLVQK